MHKNKKNRSYRDWTDAELEYLAREYGRKTASELAQELGRGEIATSTKAHELRVAGESRVEKLTRDHWTDFEDRYLKNAYDHKPIQEIAQELGRTESAIRSRAHRLQLTRASNTKNAPRRRWTDADIKYLTHACGHKTTSELARELNRTEDAVLFQVRKLRASGALEIKSAAHRRWTTDEISYLKNEYGRRPASSIAHELDRSVKAVFAKADKLQLKSSPDARRGTGRFWSDNEREYLKRAYEHVPTSAIARNLGRSQASVSAQARKIQLRRERIREKDEYEPWNQREDAIVRNEFMSTSIMELSKRLDRTEASIYKRARVLGVNARR